MTFSNENRLEKFIQEGLGLLRDNKVRLVGHCDNWSKIFSQEAALISEKLDINSLKLYHCGSTAISGIIAKPIIDVVGEVIDLNELDDKKERLEDIGYEYKGEYGIEGRRYSVLCDAAKTTGYCHLHIFENGNPKLQDHIIFRDYLRSNINAATRYEQVKKSLNIPRNEYSNAKTEIIFQLLAEAKKF